ncbi:WD domain, G-beta repeat protein [Ancylostoma ceylanicum]|uniref:Coronin n=1 Tax=Ancylostoma ceylanicum TaxID=53326 RepID=A0A0D6LFH3_9BILA|nr:WD domain, G-beta repeat protein [Ancylostoma ceylanicum]
MPSEEECPSGSRAATFRHIFGQTTARGEWFDWGAGHGSGLVANPKFIAVALEGSAGGQILVGTLEDFGKHGRVGLARLQDHTGAVTDIKWNWFNDNVLASGSADCSVKIWHVTDQLKVETQCVRTLARHSRRVDQVEWHTTVDNVLLSAGSDSKIFLWDVEANSIIYESDQFHPDLYPPTRGPTPAASLAEWQAGLDVVPVQLQLRPGQLTTTSKPVQLKGRSGSPKLITSDLNNEKKFRFLSQITRPDYRVVEEREDCEEITKLIEVTQKVQEGRRSSSPRSEKEEAEEASDAVAELQRSTSAVDSENTQDMRASAHEEPTVAKPPSPIVIDVVPPAAPIVSEPPEARSASSRSSYHGSSGVAPSRAERLRISPSPRHLSLDRHTKHREISPNPPLRCPGDSRISPRLTPSPLHFVDTPTRIRPVDEPISTESNPFKQYFQPELKNGVSKKISVSSRRSDDSMLSLATCGTAPIVAAESVDDLDTEVSILNGNLRDDGSGSETARSFDEGHRLLENTVTMLERQLRRCDARIQQLERLCELQQCFRSAR